MAIAHRQVRIRKGRIRDPAFFVYSVRIDLIRWNGIFGCLDLNGRLVCYNSFIY